MNGLRKERGKVKTGIGKGSEVSERVPGIDGTGSGPQSYLYSLIYIRAEEPPGEKILSHPTGV